MLVCKKLIVSLVLTTVAAGVFESLEEDRAALFQHGVHVHLTDGRPALAGQKQTIENIEALTGLRLDPGDLNGASISDAPWNFVDRHTKVAEMLLSQTRNSVKAADHFLRSSERRKARFQKIVLDGKYCRWKLWDFLHPLMRQWDAVADTFKDLKNPPDNELADHPIVADRFKKLADLMSSFGQNLGDLNRTMIRRADMLGLYEPEVIPYTLEVMNSYLASFMEMKDKVLQEARDYWESSMKHLLAQIQEPIVPHGPGICVDSFRQEYATYEAPGCDDLLECFEGCRGWPERECRGVTFTEQDGNCGKCELRMEPDAHVQSVTSWRPAWRAGKGTGPIKGVKASGTSTFCYKREVPEWVHWPDKLRTLINKDLATLERDLREANRRMMGIFFKLDRGFWQVEGAFRYVTKEVVLAAPKPEDPIDMEKHENEAREKEKEARTKSDQEEDEKQEKDEAQQEWEEKDKAEQDKEREEEEKNPVEATDKAAEEMEQDENREKGEEEQDKDKGEEDEDKENKEKGEEEEDQEKGEEREKEGQEEEDREKGEEEAAKDKEEEEEEQHRENEDEWEVHGNHQEDEEAKEDEDKDKNE